MVGRSSLALGALAIALAALAACASESGGETRQSTSAIDRPARADGPLCFRPASLGARTITVAAVGDILLHDELQKQAFDQGFASLFDDVQPWLSGADLAYGNFEGAVSGPIFDADTPENDPLRKGIDRNGRLLDDPGRHYDGVVYTEFSMFGYHPDLAPALADLGIDVVSTANNHTLDRRGIGVDRTLLALERAGIAHTGAERESESNAERLPAAFTEAGGMRIAWVACTYGTNGVPDDHYQVTMCYGPGEADRRARGLTIAPYSHQANPDLVREIETLAQDDTVDAIIVTPHWGSEYQHVPKYEQGTLARTLFDAGATVILGAHPHSVQPWERDEATGGLLVYSHGNFVSGQGENSCAGNKGCKVAVRTGLMTFFKLAKDDGAKARVVEASYAPLTMLDSPTWHVVRSDRVDRDALSSLDRALVDESLALTEEMYGAWNRQDGFDLTGTPACSETPHD